MIKNSFGLYWALYKLQCQYESATPETRFQAFGFDYLTPEEYVELTANALYCALPPLDMYDLYLDSPDLPTRAKMDNYEHLRRVLSVVRGIDEELLSKALEKAVRLARDYHEHKTR